MVDRDLQCCLEDCTFDFNEPYCKANLDCKSDILSSTCLQPVKNYCLGQGLSDSQWIDAWTLPRSEANKELPPCVYFLSRYLFLDTPPFPWDLTMSVPPSNLFRSSARIVEVRSFLEQLVKNYYARGFTLASPPNSPTFSPLENTLYSICLHSPGICNVFLNSFCSIARADSLERNPALARWCGCYLPEREYGKYTTQYSVTRECTPYCLRSDVIPLALPAANAPSYCQQNTCIIDDVTINLQNSEVRGGVNFSQVCGNCGEGSTGGSATCSCLISDININVINSRISGIDFNQKCANQSSKCYRSIGDIRIQVPCSSGEQVAQDVQRDLNRATFNRNLSILAYIVGAIIVVGLIWFLVIKL